MTDAETQDPGPLPEEPEEGTNPADEGEATKPAETILRQEISVGTGQLERPARGLFLSAVSGGLDIGFGPFLMLAVLAVGPGDTLSTRLLAAFAYAIGFLIVILGRSELFTEHTTLAVLPLLSGEATVHRVARLWGLVYAGNMVGAVSFAALAAWLGPGLGLFGEADAADLARHITEPGSLVVFGSGVAAGWLMGLMSWLVTAARDTMSQVVIILLVAASIGLLGLHHSIAGTIEVLVGVFAGEPTMGDWFRFLAPATLGNAVGGVVLVAALKYGHIARVDPIAAR